MSNEEQFMAITGTTDPSVATNYIEMAGGNVEMAIGLYMEHGGAGGGGGGNSAPAAAAAAVPSVGGGARGDSSMMDADAALAASMAAQDAQEADDVRAPDATRTMRLMDETAGPMGAMMMGGAGVGGGDGSYGMMDPNMRMMQELMEEQLNRPNAFASPTIGGGSRRRGGGAREAVDAAAESKEDSHDDDDDEDNQEYNYDDEDEEDDDVNMDDDEGENNNVTNPPRLSDMFAAPKHLLHTAGGFSGARQMAKDSKRWLLVNIQRDSEFSSHALNRDVWHNDLVENLVREGFIFWQEDDTHPEGQQFVQRYHVQEFPHISMIDPRTGRLLWKKEGWTQQNPLTAEAFAEFAMDFCSRNSFARPPVAPKPPAAKSTGGSTNNGINKNKPVEFLTEEEQLEAAVKASMEDSKMAAAPTNGNGAINSDNGKNGSDGVHDLGHSAPQPVPAAAPAGETKSFAQELLDVAVPDETEGGAKISFRMPNGSRVVRSFSGSDSVKVVYAFVAQSLVKEIEENGKKEIMLKAGYPPKDLKPRMLDTIDEAALKGEVVSVRWV